MVTDRVAAAQEPTFQYREGPARLEGDVHDSEEERREEKKNETRKHRNFQLLISWGFTGFCMKFGNSSYRLAFTWFSFKHAHVSEKDVGSDIMILTGVL